MPLFGEIRNPNEGFSDCGARNSSGDPVCAEERPDMDANAVDAEKRSRKGDGFLPVEVAESPVKSSGWDSGAKPAGAGWDALVEEAKSSNWDAWVKPAGTVAEPANSSGWDIWVKPAKSWGSGNVAEPENSTGWEALAQVGKYSGSGSMAEPVNSSGWRSWVKSSGSNSWGQRGNQDQQWQQEQVVKEEPLILQWHSGELIGLSELSMSVAETKPSGVGLGLNNLGNTCFMNAILQCFTHTAPLVQGLHSRGWGIPASCKRDGFCVLCALRLHIDFALGSSETSIAPYMFSDNLKYISSNFERGQQEDAHEFLQCLLGRLEESCLGSRSNSKCSYFEGDNLVEWIFGGSLKSKLLCRNCGHCSVTEERLIDLSLEIEDTDTLEGALESFTKVERIEDPDLKFTCERCEQKVTVEKQLILDKPPLVAAIHLKRFKTDGYRVEKISKHVSFPLELDMQPFSTGVPDNNAELKYDLYAVVVHEGFTSDSGHYYCYVRSSPGAWYRLDDYKVTRVLEQSVLTENGYILLYARKGMTWMSDLMDGLRGNDPKNSRTSPSSVLDNRDSGCTTSGSSLGADGCEDIESRKYEERPSTLADGNSRQNVAINDYSIPPVSSNCSLGNTCSDTKEFMSLNQEDNSNLEAEVGKKFLETQCASPRWDKRSPGSTFKISRDHLKSAERAKRKKLADKVEDDSQRKEALRLMKNRVMPTARREGLMNAMMKAEGASKKVKRAASSHKKDSSTSGGRPSRGNIMSPWATSTLF